MGRRRIDILIPNFPFTTRDLKAQNPDVSAFVIQRNLQEWISGGIVRRIGTEAYNGPGKACYLFQAVAASRPHADQIGKAPKRSRPTVHHATR